MSSMDKRRGGLVGRPVKKTNLHVVLGRDEATNDRKILAILSTSEKAHGYIAEERMKESPQACEYEHWQLQ